MKRTLFTLLSLIAISMSTAVPAFAVNINRNINSATVNAVQQETFDERKELTQQALEVMEDILGEVESNLQQSPYASAQTKEDGQEALDAAQGELDDIQADVDAATTTAELTAARQDAVAWAKENKDLAKDVMVDLYIDGLNATIAYNEQVINTSDTLVAYFKRYTIDTTTLESLLKQAKNELTPAESDVATATQQRTQAALETATRSTATVTETTTKILVEVEKLYEQLEAQ